MNKPLQTFTAPSGDQLVVLTRADYDELVQRASVSEEDEDAELIAIANARMADPAASARLPAEISRLLLSGASLLKALRLWKDVGQVKLAHDIGTSQGFISDLENGRRPMTEEVRGRIAQALDVPGDWLLPG
ncbi:MAG: helix-turn-helix transcriptional regulator [Devosia sp.]